jgi:hypothetical protein
MGLARVKSMGPRTVRAKGCTMIRLRAWRFVAAGAPLTLLLAPVQAPVRQAQGWPVRHAQGMPRVWVQHHRALQGGSAWSGWPWVVTIAVIAVAAVIWFLLARRQRHRSRRTCRLELANLGNVRSRYELRAEDPGQALQFSFVLGGARLYGQSVTPPAAPSAALRAGPSTSSGQAPSTSNGTFASGQAPSTSRRGELVEPSGQVAASSLRKAGRAKGWAMRTGSAVAGALSTLGALLPRSASGPLRQVASQIRRGGGAVRRAEHLTRRAGRLRPVPAPEAPSTRPSTGVEEAPAAASSDAAAQTWVQTPFVEAGDTLAIDLLISPTDPYQTAYFPFTVTSRSLDAPDAPLIAEEGSVHVLGLTLFQRLGPLLVALTIGMMLLFITSLFIGNGP